MGKESIKYGQKIYFPMVRNDWWYNLPLVKVKENGMRLNIKSMPFCVACEFWDDVGRTAMSPTISSSVWNVKEKEKRMCSKRRLPTSAIGRCQKYKCKIKGL